MFLCHPLCILPILVVDIPVTEIAGREMDITNVAGYNVANMASILK